MKKLQVKPDIKTKTYDTENNTYKEIEKIEAKSN